ncbi:interleukin-1 receptor type 2 [Scomber japonicus]|uniref:interleukin-1 receptor type 2 n=1 Tax=Scomber japonicus TaxID=13676 RepID=UPI0023063C35|nr:interleukin-1 receptor type 2 [Scomber japonicus]
MVCLALMFTVVIVEYVYGGPLPPLPPLPMKDGCFLISPEVEVFRLEGEAVILDFPSFQSVLRKRSIALPTATYLIARGNGTGAYEGEGRVHQHDKQLWLLPAQASDSGKYTCTYRNETYCVTGSITLHVFESSSVDMKKLSYPIPTTVGMNLTVLCPSLENFNQTNQIEWYKDSSPTALQLGTEDRGELMIQAVKVSQAGFYTCQLRVLINNQQYKVSRTILLQVEGSDPAQTTTTTAPHVSMTSGPGLISITSSSSSSSTIHTPKLRPPVIAWPLNGTIYESSHGSGLELFCQVLTGCQEADSTVVTWLVNGQSVESSYLDGRALQGEKRQARLSEGCQIELRLIVLELREEDVKTQLKCVTQNQGGTQEVIVQLQLEDSTFTWVVVAVVAVSCLLTVVSIYLYVLFKPIRKKKMDYFLARQNSTF